MKKIAVDGEKMALVLWILLLLAIVILNGMVGDWGRLAGGPDNLVRFFFQSLWPPDMSVLEPQSYPVCTAHKNRICCNSLWDGINSPAIDNGFKKSKSSMDILPYPLSYLSM